MSEHAKARTGLRRKRKRRGADRKPELDLLDTHWHGQLRTAEQHVQWRGQFDQAGELPLLRADRTWSCAEGQRLLWIDRAAPRSTGAQPVHPGSFLRVVGYWRALGHAHPQSCEERRHCARSRAGSTPMKCNNEAVRGSPATLPPQEVTEDVLFRDTYS